MTFRTLLVAKAAVCLVFGVLLLFVPTALFGMFGMDLSGAGTFPAREYGAAMIGTLLLTWFARDVTAPDARGAILLYLLTYDAIGLIVTLPVVISGVMNVLGWVIVVIYAFFAIGAAYLLVHERPVLHLHAHGRA